MAIAEGLSALKTGFDIARTINQRVKEGRLYPKEISDQLLHLQQALLDSQGALNDAAEEIRVLKEHLAAQSKLDEQERDLEWMSDGGFWVRKSEREAGTVIRYCPLCWGDNRRLVPLNLASGKGCFFCPIHKASHETEEYRNWRRQQSVSIGTVGSPGSWMG